MKVKQELFIDIGGGKQPKGINPKYQWEIMDSMDKSYKYGKFDLNSGKPFPLDNNSVSSYYKSMTLEHIHPTKVQHVLNEMYRTLMPKGKVRIVVPDIEIGIKLYLKDPKKLETPGMPYITPGYHPLTKCGLLFSWINSPLRPDQMVNGRTGHQMMFDYETLVWYLNRSKFVNITRMKFNECSEQFTGKDGPRYADWALFVEATK